MSTKRTRKRSPTSPSNTSEPYSHKNTTAVDHQVITRGLNNMKKPALNLLKRYKTLVLKSKGRYNPDIHKIKDELNSVFANNPELVDLIHDETRDENIRIILENAWSPSKLPIYNILIKRKTVKARSLPYKPDMQFKVAPHSADNLPQYINKDLRNLTGNIMRIKSQHKSEFVPKQNKSGYLVLKNNWMTDPSVIARAR